MHSYHIIYTTQSVKKTFKCPVPKRLCNKLIHIIMNFLSIKLKGGSWNLICMKGRTFPGTKMRRKHIHQEMHKKQKGNSQEMAIFSWPVNSVSFKQFYSFLWNEKPGKLSNDGLEMSLYSWSSLCHIFSLPLAPQLALTSTISEEDWSQAKLITSSWGHWV